MKHLRHILAGVLALTLTILTLGPVQVKAASRTQQPESGNCVRIAHVSGKYLDVPAEKSQENGAQLQLWDRVEGAEGQVFYMEKTDGGWRIRPMCNNHVLEVRDSSHRNEAEVAIWSYHEGDNALWEIRKNNDGTVSFRNVESGLYMNVLYGAAQNGQPIIQYEDDGTDAMRFYLEVCEYSDVFYSRYDLSCQQQKNDLIWEDYSYLDGKVINHTGFSLEEGGRTYAPSGNSRILRSVEFFSDSATHKWEEHLRFLGWKNPGKPVRVLTYTVIDAASHEENGRTVVTLTTFVEHELSAWDGHSLDLPAWAGEGEWSYRFR